MQDLYEQNHKTYWDIKQDELMEKQMFLDTL